MEDTSMIIDVIFEELQGYQVSSKVVYDILMNNKILYETDTEEELRDNIRRLIKQLTLNGYFNLNININSLVGMPKLNGRDGYMRDLIQNERVLMNKISNLLVNEHLMINGYKLSISQAKVLSYSLPQLFRIMEAYTLDVRNDYVLSRMCSDVLGRVFNRTQINYVMSVCREIEETIKLQMLTSSYPVQIAIEAFCLIATKQDFSIFSEVLAYCYVNKLLVDYGIGYFIIPDSDINTYRYLGTGVIEGNEKVVKAFMNFLIARCIENDSLFKWR